MLKENSKVVNEGTVNVDTPCVSIEKTCIEFVDEEPVFSGSTSTRTSGRVQRCNLCEL